MLICFQQIEQTEIDQSMDDGFDVEDGFADNATATQNNGADSMGDGMTVTPVHIRRNKYTRKRSRRKTGRGRVSPSLYLPVCQCWILCV